MKKPKLVYIEWTDAFVNGDGWLSAEDAKNWAQTNDWLVKQSGFVIEENDKYMLIASKYNPAEEIYSDLTKIPKTWIRKRKVISY